MGLEAACILITASFCMKSQTNAKYMNGGDLNMQQMDRQMNRQQKIMAAKASFQRTDETTWNKLEEQVQKLYQNALEQGKKLSKDSAQ